MPYRNRQEWIQIRLDQILEEWLTSPDRREELLMESVRLRAELEKWEAAPAKEE